jgi:oxygen-independent coproporphyrinogen-3 oxidase
MAHPSRDREATESVWTPRAVVASFTGAFGLYLHVPFCRSICPFCPYNKVLLREGLAAPYFAALGTELELYDALELRFESLYVGGGTPSLCLEEVGALVESLDVTHERAIELMPNHVTPRTVSLLHELGFDYVSLGIQSFDAGMLRHLGRTNSAEDNRRALAATVGAFSCVNADLIFDVAFLEPDLFLRDFEECGRAGVDQISTYPLMHFGYTPFGKAPERPRAEHELLRSTCELAHRLGYERRSVWTFNRAGGPLYASIARERYLGCGAGAATFTGGELFLNHFGLAQYQAALGAGRLPIVRRARLDPVRAGLYQAFWQLYAPGVDPDRLALLPGGRIVRPLLWALRLLGYLELRNGRVCLTERGFDRYHDLERWVTYQLIEPLWEEMLEEHPPRDRPTHRATRSRAGRYAGMRITGPGLRRRPGGHGSPAVGCAAGTGGSPGGCAPTSTPRFV